MPNLCYKCFSEYENSAACPNCGYNAAAEEGKYPHALKPGSILGGRYILGRVLGQGGFGITYIAQDYDTKQLVAIKEFMPETLATRMEHGRVTVFSPQHEEDFASGKLKFLDEAKTLSQFNGQSNICDIYSYFEENGTAYFAMEYVEGTGLDRVLKTQGTVSVERAKELLLPIMHALSHVHEKGIIHRDISPDNIIVKPDGSVMLIDFGAARYSLGEKSRSLDVILKHGFAPKEQYTRRGRQGPFTDVYAVAATFYYAITGKVPPEAIDRIDADELAPPSTLGVKIDKATEAALLKALSVSAPERFQSMGDFAAAMSSKKAADTKTADKKAEAVKTKPAADKKPKKKKNGLIAAVLAVLILAGAGLMLMPDKAEESAAIPEAAVIAEGQAGENISWQLLEDGCFVLSGKGAMVDYSFAQRAPWYEHRREIKSLSVSDNVTSISDFAFKDCVSLSGLELPDSIERIGRYAFYGCSKLQQTEIPDSLKELGSYAFAECVSLRVCHLPDEMDSIGSHAFDGCRSMSELRMPLELKELGTLSVNGCTSLTEFKIPHGIESLDGLCYDAVLQTVVFPDTMTKMPHIVGMGGVRILAIPASITEIAEYTFSQSIFLKEIHYSGTEAQWRQMKIGDYNTALSKAEIHYNCDMSEFAEPLEEISWSVQNDTLYINGEGAMEDYAVPMIQPWYPSGGKIKTIIIADGVEHISNNAFVSFGALESVTIPASVKSIGDYAFSNCRKLESVEFKGTDRQWNKISIGENNDELLRVRPQE